MRLLLVAIAASIPATAHAVSLPKSAPAVVPKEIANCPQASQYHAWRSGKALKPQKLADLPDANAYKAVLRQDGRCEVPVVIKYGVGGR